MNPVQPHIAKTRQIREYLLGDYRNGDAFDGFSKNVIAAERALGATIGDNPIVHAWIERTPEKELDVEGAIWLITPEHLITATYDKNARSIARIELLQCTGVEVETVWEKAGTDESNWLARASVTLQRPTSKIEFDVRNMSLSDDRAENMLASLDALKSRMIPTGEPSA